MTRRINKDGDLMEGILDLFLDVCKTLPWWLTLPVAALLYIFVPFDFPVDIQIDEPKEVIPIFFLLFLKMLGKYLIPLTLLVGATISLLNKFMPPNLKNEDECPRCGSSLVQRTSLRGRFIGCSSFPKCRYTRDL